MRRLQRLRQSGSERDALQFVRNQEQGHPSELRSGFGGSDDEDDHGLCSEQRGWQQSDTSQVGTGGSHQLCNTRRSTLLHDDPMHAFMPVAATSVGVMESMEGNSQKKRKREKEVNR